MSELHHAALSVHPGWVQTCLARGDPVDELDERGRTPLLCVCQSGASETALACARLLLDAGASPNHAFMHGSSSLQLACDTGNLELVRLLLDRGADVNLVAADLSPLMFAISSDQEEVAALLLDRGADVHYTFSRRTARDYAYRHGLLVLARRIEQLQQTTERGASDDDG